MTKNTMLLAVDTAARTGSVALCGQDGVAVAYTRLQTEHKHGATLAESVANLPGIDFEQIGAYALTIGPGSFTGLRIGLAFLKGIASVYPRPVVAISTLAVIARGLFDQLGTSSDGLVLLDARRGQVYAGLYSGIGKDEVESRPSLKEGLYRIEDISTRMEGPGLVTVGDGAPLLDHATQADRVLWEVDARVLGRMAWHRAQQGRGEGIARLEPVYYQSLTVSGDEFLGQDS